MRPCRECGKEISEQAVHCPHCGAPYPARAKWDGWGFEYKSQASFLGLPLLHISFKYRPNRAPVVAKGVISIGQFGIGLISISQFTIGVFALAQFALAWKMIAQIGIYIEEGRGQLVWSLQEIIRLLS